MPTILRKDGFAFLVYTNDHRPAHVHIFRAEAEMIVYLGDEANPPSIRENMGMNRRDARMALVICGEFQEFLLAEWRRIHG